MRSWSEIVRLPPMGVNDCGESYLLLHVGNTVFGLAFSYGSKDYATQTRLLSERNGKAKKKSFVTDVCRFI